MPIGMREPIELSDSESDNPFGTPSSSRERTIGRTPSPNGVGVGDEDDDSGLDDEVAETDGHEHRQLEAIRARQQVPADQRIIDSVFAYGIKIRPGMCFELAESEIFLRKDSFRKTTTEVGFRDFVRIEYITRDKATASAGAQSGVTLHVLRLRRTKYCDLKWNAGEVCAIILAMATDHRPDFDRGRETCSLDAIIPLPRNIVFTNRIWEPGQFQGGTGQKRWEEGTLVCRWKRVHLFPGPRETKITEEAWLRLSQEEADPGCGVPDALSILEHLHKGTQRKLNFLEDQRNKQPSRAKRSGEEDDEGAEVEADRPSNFPTCYKGSGLSTLGLRLFDRDKKYGFGDHFCGIGGVSADARKAGLQNNFGFDFAAWAVASYRRNFPAAETSEMHCSDFYTSGTAYRTRYAAIIHFSPPCQPFSQNHTVEGKNDEANRDANLSIQDGLFHQFPRFATLEQTSSIKTHDKKELNFEYFHMVKRQFTDSGYNVRLAIINLAEHGCPSQRKRLIIMASCPGESLPEFPPPARGAKHGLPPFVTVGEAIHGISANDPLHQPDEPRNGRAQNKPCAKVNETLPSIILTAGPAYLHPSGRPFTLAEGLALQRFPRGYKLAPGIPDSWAWRGIGNSVPGGFLCKVYERQIAELKASDEKIKAYLMRIAIDVEEEAPPTPGPSTPMRRPAGEREEIAGLRLGTAAMPHRAAKRQRAVDGTARSQRERVSRSATAEGDSSPASGKVVIDLTDD